MAVNCQACADLRENATEFITNGVTDSVCTSLKNDTGFNPSASPVHNDCTDLENANDCLIGNMEDELEAYEVCDWKSFMRRFITNLHAVVKAIICAVCGLWTNVHSLDSRIDYLCELLSAQMKHPVKIFGTTPNLGISSQQGGTIATKGGLPIITPLLRSEVASDEAWSQQNCGFRYGKLQSYDCNGSCKRYEWIAPDLYAYRFNEDVTPEYDDMIWSIDKASVVGRMGMSQEMWNIREDNPIQWTTDWAAGGGVIALRLSVESDRLVLRYRGSIGASGSDLSGKQILSPADQAERLYTFNC